MNQIDLGPVCMSSKFGVGTDKEADPTVRCAYDIGKHRDRRLGDPANFDSDGILPGKTGTRKSASLRIA